MIRTTLLAALLAPSIAAAGDPVFPTHVDFAGQRLLVLDELPDLRIIERDVYIPKSSEELQWLDDPTFEQSHDRFLEILVPWFDFYFSDPAPLHDVQSSRLETVDQPRTFTTQAPPEIQAEYDHRVCITSTEMFERVYIHHAHYYWQNFDIYHRNQSLDEWYALVDVYTDVGISQATDLMLTVGMAADAGVISAKGALGEASQQIDFAVDMTLDNPGEVEASAEGVFGIADAAAGGGAACGFTYMADKCIKPIKVGLATWGITLGAVTSWGTELGLLPQSETYQGYRPVLMGVMYPYSGAYSPELSGTTWIDSAPFPCDGDNLPVSQKGGERLTFEGIDE